MTSPEDFRRAVGRYATGVVVLTTVVDGEDHAMTSNSFTSVSLDPLLVLFCVERGARFHEAVLASGSWNVSVLGAGAQEAARWFATRGRPLVGQFDRVPHLRGDNGAPLVGDALSWLECETVQINPAGDHDVVVGRVVRLAEPAGESGPALVYWRSGFHRLG